MLSIFKSINGNVSTNVIFCPTILLNFWIVSRIIDHSSGLWLNMYYVSKLYDTYMIHRRIFWSSLSNSIWKGCWNICISSLHAKYAFVFGSNCISVYPIWYCPWKDGFMCHYFPITDSSLQWGKVCKTIYSELEVPPS